MAQKSVDEALASNLSSVSAEDDAASKKTDSSSKTSKSRGTATGSKLSLRDLDRRFAGFESTFSDSLAKITDFMDKMNDKHTGASGTQRQRHSPHISQVALGTSSVRGDDSHLPAPQGRQRIISLNNGIDPDIVPEDVLSIQPSRREVENLYGLDRGSSGHSSVSDQSEMDGRDRFSRFSNPDTPKLLGELFGTDMNNNNECTDTGLILDDSQISVLNKSWRSQAPDRVTCFKEEYKTCFPVHEKTAEVLQVPGLDDIIEPMLQKRHRSFKPWGKAKQLCSQPLKTIETLGYQGMLASRMNIVALAYLQQGLGALLSTLKEKDCNVDRAIQNVRDLYDISNKALDQAGRAGSFHHMIRRKATVSDTGLNTLKDVHSKIMFLPLSGEALFGQGLTEKLKSRKEQKDQLSDLVPEFFERAPKRKLNSAKGPGPSNAKQPRFDSPIGYRDSRQSAYTPAYSRGRSHAKSSSYRGNRQRESPPVTQNKERGAAAQPFRIPKKQ